MKHHFLIFWALLAIGFGSGLINGLLGAGGGILIVYGLNRFLKKAEDPRSIYAAAIAVILPLSILSAVRYFRHGSLSLDSIYPLILPAVLGGAVGAMLLRRLSPAALARIFAAVVLVSGITMVV